MSISRCIYGFKDQKTSQHSFTSALSGFSLELKQDQDVLCLFLSLSSNWLTLCIWLSLPAIHHHSLSTHKQEQVWQTESRQAGKQRNQAAGGQAHFSLFLSDSHWEPKVLSQVITVCWVSRRERRRPFLYLWSQQGHNSWNWNTF